MIEEYSASQFTYMTDHDYQIALLETGKNEKVHSSHPKKYLTSIMIEALGQRPVRREDEPPPDVLGTFIVATVTDFMHVVGDHNV